MSLARSLQPRRIRMLALLLALAGLLMSGGLWQAPAAGAAGPHSPRLSPAGLRTGVDGAGADEPFTLLSISPAGLVTVNEGEEAWGDYDRDGDLDLLMLGQATVSGLASTRLYRNDGPDGAGWTLTAVEAGLPQLEYGSAAWGDFDRDGELDLALSGHDGAASQSAIYRNDAGAFVLHATLAGLRDSDLAWGDFDNDGELDLFITGATSSGSAAYLYRNSAGSFAAISSGILGVSDGACAWGDFDNDGDLDLLLSGRHSAGASWQELTTVYRNDGPLGAGWSFSNLYPSASFPGTRYLGAKWGDYSGDGRLDAAVGGGPYPNEIASLYRNAGPAQGGWSFTPQTLPAIAYSDLDWGDYDGDGDYDLAMTGLNGWAAGLTRVYRNDGAGQGGNWIFGVLEATLPGSYNNGLEWGDLDGDGDLDLLLSAYGVYRNNAVGSNSRPAAPSGLSALVRPGGVTLSWNPASDAQTPSAGLSYSLRVGTAPGAADIVAPPALVSAGATGGRRTLQSLGELPHDTAASLRLPPGSYYWSVQSVDSALAGSPFAAEGSFRVVEGRPALVYLPLLRR